MEVRKFRLLNSDGAAYDFMLTSHFLHSPSGLGFSRSDTFLHLGNRFVRVNKQVNQWGPSGTIAFTGDSNNQIYKNYNNFVQFISKEPLKLKYTPEDTEYTMNVVVANLEKTEINEKGYLDCNIQFSSLTPWYKVVTFDYYDGAGLVPSDKYPNAHGLYPKNGLVPRNPTNTAKIFFNNGTLESPGRLKIYGPITNPFWDCGPVDGTIAPPRQGRVNISVASNEVLIVDSTTIPFRICKASTATEFDEKTWVDVYEYSDFDTSRYICYPPQVDCLFTLYNPSTAINKPTRIIMEVHEYYESV